MAEAAFRQPEVSGKGGSLRYSFFRVEKKCVTARASATRARDLHPGRELDSVLLERRSRDAVDVLVDVLVREL